MAVKIKIAPQEPMPFLGDRRDEDTVNDDPRVARWVHLCPDESTSVVALVTM